MFLLPWTKAAKAHNLMTKLEQQYSQLQSQPLSEFPEVADLQLESTQIELAKIAHTHYLLRREHPDLGHSKLPLSPGIVIDNRDDLFYQHFLPYTEQYKASPKLADFFNAALQQANQRYTASRLASISSKLSYTYTNTDILVIYEYLAAHPSATQYFYRGSALTPEDLEPIAIHFKVDVIFVY